MDAEIVGGEGVHVTDDTEDEDVVDRIVDRVATVPQRR
jgi:hypothetical protein